MGFCSYCGDSTDGQAAVCEPCRCRNAASREKDAQLRFQRVGPTETFPFSRTFLTCCTVAFLLGALVFLGPGFNFGSGGGTAPTLTEVEPLVRAHLTELGNNCTISKFSNLSVGEFNPMLGGWPVYVSHQTTCHNGSSKMTYNGIHSAEEKVATTFVRRGLTGSLQEFTPEVFRSVQGEFGKEVQKLGQDMQESLNRLGR